MAAMAAGEEGATALMTSCCSNSNCDISKTTSEDDQDEGGGCAGCCDRFAPEGASEQSLPDIDDVGTACLIPSGATFSTSTSSLIGLRRAEVRPPDPPPSSLLSLRCKLQV
jgi:hypothetical protein